MAPVRAKLISNATQLHVRLCCRGLKAARALTRVHAVAGDVTSSQPLGQLVREEHVAQFAVAVGLEELPAEAAGAQVSVLQQSLNTTRR